MKLGQFLVERPLREVVITYVASTWGGLEIVVTMCELVGVSIIVPQILSLLMLVGLILILGIRLIKSIKSKPRQFTWSLWTRNLVGLGVFFALLPMSFAGHSVGEVDWIMWQDAPTLASSFAVLAVLTLLGAYFSNRRDRSD